MHTYHVVCVRHGYVIYERLFASFSSRRGMFFDYWSSIPINWEHTSDLCEILHLRAKHLIFARTLIYYFHWYFRYQCKSANVPLYVGDVIVAGFVRAVEMICSWETCTAPIIPPRHDLFSVVYVCCISDVTLLWMCCEFAFLCICFVPFECIAGMATVLMLGSRYPAYSVFTMHALHNLHLREWTKSDHFDV